MFLDQKSCKPVVLKTSWLIITITRDFKNTTSWSLPHSELVQIFGDGTPEYVVLQAPHVILINSQVLKRLPYTSQTSLNVGPRARLNSPQTLKPRTLCFNKHQKLFGCEFGELDELCGQMELGVWMWNYWNSLSFLPNHLFTQCKKINWPVSLMCQATF